VGGYAGVSVARRLSRAWLQAAVVGYGVVVAVVLLLN
jgi:hypothetical protein